MVVWIGYLQWMHQHGEPITDEPILEKLTNIQHADAILRYDTEGKPYEPTWPKATYIIGNPPFLGGNRIRKELGDKYTDDLFNMYAGRVPAFSDLVSYWFERARLSIEDRQATTAGLLATQSIRGGVNRDVLKRIITDGNTIFWAYSDRAWMLNGAVVHISMIAFGRQDYDTIYLNGEWVDCIHADLSSGADTTHAFKLIENAHLCFMGVSPKGPFDISSGEAQKMLDTPVNINGRTNHDVLKPVLSSVDIGGRGRNVWTIDFGIDMPEREAAQYEMPFEYVKHHVLPKRLENRRDAYKNRWWIFGEARPGMRRALSTLTRYVATPAVAKHRLFVWVPTTTLCNQGALVFARSDDYFLGVLTSRLHEMWARQVGTQLREAESGFRYTPDTTFDTFPFPWPPNTEPKEDPRVQAIAAAAKSLVGLRDRWLNPPDTPEADLKKRTLTNLYNNKPQWLQDAHHTLDQAVFAAYNWPPTLTDQQILQHLLTLNHQRAAPQKVV